MNFLDLILDNIVTIIGWGAGGIFFVSMLYMRSQFVTKADHDKLKEVVDDVAKRIDHVEIQVKQLPDMGAIQNLALQLTRFEGDIKSFMTRFESVDHLLGVMQNQADRMETYLRSGK